MTPGQDSGVEGPDKLSPPGLSRACATGITLTWVACRSLAAAGGGSLFGFPLRVEPGDRPDLVVTMASRRTGIEITEAVPEDKARVDAYSEHKWIGDWRLIPHYRVNDTRRSRAEIEKSAKGEARILPRMGDSVERDWVDAILHFIIRKTESFMKPGFARHPSNWLLVHDNWSAVLNERVATERLNRYVFDHGPKNPFCKVFVLRPRSLLEFAPGAAIVEHPIPEDWLVQPGRSLSRHNRRYSRPQRWKRPGRFGPDSQRLVRCADSPVTPENRGVHCRPPQYRPESGTKWSSWFEQDEGWRSCLESSSIFEAVPGRFRREENKVPLNSEKPG